MKPISKRIASMLLLALGCCPAAPDSAQAQTIRLEGDVWAPYVMDPAGGKKGYMVDVAELALTRAGYKVSFSVVPWTRSLKNAADGESDGIVGIYFSQARKWNFVLPAEELGISINHLFVRKDSTWTFAGPESLRSMVLGTIAEYDYGDLNAYIDTMKARQPGAIQVSSGNDALQKNIRMLLIDRVAVLIEDPIVVGYLARQIGVDQQLKSAGMVGPPNPVGIAFSPRNPRAAEYARALSDGIDKLRRSGELKTILAGYYVPDWKQR